MNSIELTKAMETWALKECQTIYDRMYEGSKDKTPVKTGFAKASWQPVNKITYLGETGRFTNQAPYIGWLEFGTDRMYPRHMVTMTILEVKRDYS